METAEKIYHIYFNENLEAVVMEWNGYATTAQFREGTELMLNTLIQNKTDKVLADIRNMTLISMDDQKWMETNFLPRAIHFGFKKIAIITPSSYFNKIAVENISYKVDQDKLRIHFFEDLDEGRSWLQKN